MNEFLSGICFLVSLSCLSFMAWKFLRQRDYRKSLFVVLLIALFLRIIGATDPYLHSWDERYHALVAKNLIEHPLSPTLIENPILSFDNDNWVGGNIWLGKPALPLWIMSGSISVFGNNLFAVRLPSVLLGLLAVWLTFLIGRRLFDERIGLLAAYLHGINGLIIELIGGRVSSDHVEACFIVMVEVAVYFLLRHTKDQKNYKAIFFAGIFTGLAFLSKWYPAFIVFPVWFTFFVTREKFNWLNLIKEGSLLVLGFVITALPWTFYMLNTYPEETNAILFNALTAYASTVQSHDAPFYYYLHKIMVIYGELVYVVLAYSIYRTFKAENKFQYVGLLTWIFLPLVIFSFADTKRFPYILIAAPAFFILTSWCWFHVREEFLNSRLKWLNGILLIGFIAFPLIYMVDRTKLFGGNELVPKYYTLSDTELGKLNENAIVFGTDDYIEMMFHTEVYAAYRRIPSEKRMKELIDEGFILYILKGSQLEEVMLLD